ncbi:MAG: hypothetical protein ABJB85_10115 [Nitrososphaerota archaeon]
MGRTVPSFRIAAEIERTRWKQFRSYLDKKDRKEFDRMYDCVKLHNNSCSNACRPVVIHAVLMSIIFEHYRELTKLMDQQKMEDTAKELRSNTLDKWVDQKLSTQMTGE